MSTARGRVGKVEYEGFLDGLLKSYHRAAAWPSRRVRYTRVTGRGQRTHTATAPSSRDTHGASCWTRPRCAVDTAG